MFTITNDQMEEIQERLDERLARKVVAQFAASDLEVPELADPEVSLRIVMEGFQRARGYGLETDGDLTTFALLTLLVSPRFDEYPPLHRLLTDGDPVSAERLQLLVDTRPKISEASSENVLIANFA